MSERRTTISYYLLFYVLRYGLIISKKKSSIGTVKKGSVFGNESSDEEVS